MLVHLELRTFRGTLPADCQPFSLQSIPSRNDEIDLVVYPSNDCFAYYSCADGSAHVFLPVSVANGYVHLSDIIRKLSLSHDSRYIVKNYIEPGCLYFYNDVHRSDILLYAMLGDTHHVSGSFAHATHHLLFQRYDAITSLANPAHLALYVSYFGSSRCFINADYHTAIAQSPIEVLTSSRPFLYSICSTLSHYQYHRTRVLKSICRSPYKLANTHLYAYSCDQNQYVAHLQKACYSLVPSLSGQISPQIITSLFAGRIPVCEAYHQLNMFHSYSQLLSCIATVNNLEHDDWPTEDPARYFRNLLDVKHGSLQKLLKYPSKIAMLNSLLMSQDPYFSWDNQYLHDPLPSISHQDVVQLSFLCDIIFLFAPKMHKYRLCFHSSIPLYWQSLLKTIVFQIPHLVSHQCIDFLRISKSNQHEIRLDIHSNNRLWSNLSPEQATHLASSLPHVSSTQSL